LNQLREKNLNTSKPTLIQDKLSATIDLRSLIDEIPMGVVLFNVDRRIVWMNRAFESLTGFSREEAAGIPRHHILVNP